MSRFALATLLLMSCNGTTYLEADATADSNNSLLDGGADSNSDSLLDDGEDAGTDGIATSTDDADMASDAASAVDTNLADAAIVVDTNLADAIVDVAIVVDPTASCPGIAMYVDNTSPHNRCIWLVRGETAASAVAACLLHTPISGSVASLEVAQAAVAAGYVPADNDCSGRTCSLCVGSNILYSATPSDCSKITTYLICQATTAPIQYNAYWCNYGWR